MNAPALWQLVMAEAADACVDAAAYQHKRDVLCAGLSAAGYEVSKPEGGYYVFLKTPIPDDVAFVGFWSSRACWRFLARASAAAATSGCP